MPEGARVRKTVGWIAIAVLLAGCAGANAAQPVANASSMSVASSPAPAAQPQASDSPQALADAAKHDGTPLVRGTKLTFVYQGKPGDHVQISGGVNLDLTAADQSGLFAGSVEVPDLAHAIISYTLVVNGQPTRDPLSRLPAMKEGSPVVIYRGAKAPHPAELTPNPKVPAGSVAGRTLQSSVLQESRKVWVYLPPGFSASNPCPTLLLADGQMYFDGSIHLPTILDNLIAEGKIPPVAAIGVESRTDTRLQDYVFKQPRFDAYQTFVRQELLPWAAREFHLAPAAGEMVPVGLSNGGAWALYTSLIEPDRFAGAILQSALTPESTLPPLPQGKRYFLSAGTLDPNAIALQNQLAPLLKQAGNQVKTVQGVSGHDAALMETQLVEGLTWLFAK